MGFGKVFANAVVRKVAYTATGAVMKAGKQALNDAAAAQATAAPRARSKFERAFMRAFWYVLFLWPMSVAALMWLSFQMKLQAPYDDWALIGAYAAMPAYKIVRAIIRRVMRTRRSQSV